MLVTGNHFSVRAAVSIASRHRALLTFALAAKWIPATSAGMTPHGLAGPKPGYRFHIVTGSFTSTVSQWVDARLRKWVWTAQRLQAPLNRTVVA